MWKGSAAEKALDMSGNQHLIIGHQNNLYKESMSDMNQCLSLGLR
jgi:hypothetical protein